ncbi:MAG: DUF2147 domain-containing protein [Burkholderiaceae bacterium]
MIAKTPAFFAAIAFALLAGIAHAQETPAGLWKTIDDDGKKEKSLIRITEAGGEFSGTIEKLLDPETRPDAVCDKCSDDRKDKPLLGLTMLKGVRHSETDKALWDGGEILDPKNGKTYKVQMTPIDAGKRMNVRGYIGMPLLGRTQTWIRVE